MKKSAIAGLLVLLSCVFQAHAYTWYVNLGAAPGGDGYTWATAFTNVNVALNALAATNAAVGTNGGHVIRVDGGVGFTNVNAVTWAMISNQCSGALNNPNLLITTNRFTIGFSATGARAFDFVNVDYFTVDGFYLLGGGGYAYPFRMATGKQNVIRNCAFFNCAWQAEVNTADAGHTSIVENCTFSGGGDAQIPIGATTPVIIRNCIIQNQTKGIVYSQASADVRLQHNCFYACHSPVINTAPEPDTTYFTADAINGMNANCYGNFISNPGLSDLVNLNFNQFYTNSPCLNAGIGGVDLGAHQDPPTVAVSNLTYYVSKAGSDSNDGRTWASAWASVTKAANVALAGDTVIISNGTYAAQVTITHGGSGDASVVFKAAPGGTNVVIDGGNAAFEIWRTGGIVLDGLWLTGAVYGLLFSHGYGVTVTNCRVFGCSSHGVYASAAQSAHGNTFVDSEFDSNTGYGLGQYGRWCGYVIQRCKIHHNTDDGVFGGGIWDYVDVWNSLIYSNRSDGIYLNQHDDVSRGTIENCTIYGNADHGLNLNNPYGYVVRNCIIARNGDFGLYDSYAGTAPSDIAQYNCFFENNYTNNPPGTNVWEVFGTSTNIAITASQINTGGEAAFTNNIVADPAFVDAAGGNFRLPQSSPCVDAGTVPSSSIVVDITRMPRFKGAGVDIGAYEWQPPYGSLFIVR